MPVSMTPITMPSPLKGPPAAFQRLVAPMKDSLDSRKASHSSAGVAAPKGCRRSATGNSTAKIGSSTP